MTVSQWLEHYLVVIMTVVFVGIVAPPTGPAARQRSSSRGAFRSRMMCSADQDRKGRHLRPGTTGHEWDGIKELNTPTPKWWLYVFLASIVWALGMFLLYPSIPYGTGYFHGLLGYSQRATVDAEVGKLVAQRKDSMDKIATMSFDAIKGDPALMEVALTSGRITFAENCQPCHGTGGGGIQAIRRWPPAPGSGAAPCPTSSRRSHTASAAPTPMLARVRCRASALTAY